MLLLQACLNGNRSRKEHSAVPILAPDGSTALDNEKLVAEAAGHLAG